MNLTEEFTSRVTGAFGEAGAKWIANLSQIVETAVTRWSLTLESPFEPLAYNYVAPATGADGVQLVLKSGVPCRELNTEIAALRHWNGAGAVRLIEADCDNGLLLLERAEPGTPLFEVPDDDEATKVFAAVARELHKPPPAKHNFPTIADWARGFARIRSTSSGFPQQHLERAAAMMEELIGSMNDVGVLHGDLHHWNILAAKRQPWLAIDPKGVIGEPEYEVGAWLRNPAPQIYSDPELKPKTRRRIDIIADELGFSKQRLADWCYCQAVLSAVWSYEEGQAGFKAALNYAEQLSALPL